MKRAIVLVALAFAVAGVAAQERVFASSGCIERIPGPVTDLTAVAKSDRSISVAWNAPAGDACVDTYNYVVYEKGQPEPRSIAPQARAYTITIDNLKPNTEYVVRVQAVNSLKGAGASATATVRTDRRCAPLPPGAIGNVYVNQASSTVAYLAWLPPTLGGCSTDYEVIGEETRTGRKVLNMGTASPDARVPALSPGVEYTFRITPRNRIGGGPTKRVTYRMRGPNVVASGSIPAGRKLL